MPLPIHPTYPLPAAPGELQKDDNCQRRSGMNECKEYGEAGRLMHGDDSECKEYGDAGRLMHSPAGGTLGLRTDAAKKRLTADENMDNIIRQRWKEHLATLVPEMSCCIGWKSSYWRRWFDMLDMSDLGSDIMISEDPNAYESQVVLPLADEPGQGETHASEGLDSDGEDVI